MDPVVIAIIISAFSLAFAVYSGVENLKRAEIHDVQDDSKNITSVMVELRYISKGVDDIKTEVSGLKNDIKDLSVRMTKVEESTKSAHHRIDDLNRKVGGSDEESEG